MLVFTHRWAYLVFHITFTVALGFTLINDYRITILNNVSQVQEIEPYEMKSGRPTSLVHIFEALSRRAFRF